MTLRSQSLESVNRLFLGFDSLHRKQDEALRLDKQDMFKEMEIASLQLEASLSDYV